MFPPSPNRMPRPSQQWRPGRLVIHGLIAAALALSLAGCAKRGKPKPPENQTITYPKSYPTR